MKRYNPRVEQTRKKHVLPAWAVTPTFILGVMIVVAAFMVASVIRNLGKDEGSAADRVTMEEEAARA